MSSLPVILCGGAGSRLWPVSRELYPKPFIRLADGQSQLQKAFLRAAGLPGVEILREGYFGSAVHTHYDLSYAAIVNLCITLLGFSQERLVFRTVIPA